VSPLQAQAVATYAHWGRFAMISAWSVVMPAPTSSGCVANLGW